MAESATIEERTDLFIKEYNRLKKESQLPDNKVIASLIGISSASTLSNILGRRQNIKPMAWKAFQELFLKNNKEVNSEISEENGDQEEPSAMKILAVLAEAFRAQAEVMRSIESKMAREDTQATIVANSIEILAGVRSLSKRQKQAIARTQEEFEQLKSQKAHPRQGSSKNPDQIDGEGKKRGKNPA